MNSKLYLFDHTGEVKYEVVDPLAQSTHTSPAVRKGPGNKAFLTRGSNGKKRRDQIT